MSGPLCQDQVASNLDLEFVKKLCSTRKIKTIMTDLESFSTKEEEDNKHKEAGVHTEIDFFERSILLYFPNFDHVYVTLRSSICSVGY